MDRLKGLASFVVIALVVLALVRAAHLAVPVLFPATRTGPISVASLDEVVRVAGFSPVVPAYHPAALGDRPTSITVVLSPTPTVIVAWRTHEAYLSITQRRGGPRPSAPPLATPLVDLPDSVRWSSGSENHALVWRVGYWIEIVTSLPDQDLKRFIDTLTQY